MHIEKILLHLRVLFNREKVLHQQILIDGGGHFSCKDGMSAVKEGLGRPGVVGMHGVPHFVGNGEYIFQGVRVVEKNVGLAVVAAKL